MINVKATVVAPGPKRMAAERGWGGENIISPSVNINTVFCVSKGNVVNSQDLFAANLKRR